MEETRIVEEKETPKPTLETPVVSDEQTNQVDESKQKEEQLSNLTRAIKEAHEELKQIRSAKKLAKETPQEDDVPEIDLNDPSAKAWDKHIRESVSPLQAESEAEKKEIRTFALQTFLADKPALAKNPESVKSLVALYEKIRTATERNTEGVLIDLKRAYAALHADELIATAKGQRIETAQAESLASDIAVSRGASSYQAPKKSRPTLSAEDKLQLAKWGMAEDEWIADREKYNS